MNWKIIHIDGTYQIRQIDVKQNVYRPKYIIKLIGTKNSAKRREFSSKKKKLSHLKETDNRCETGDI